MVTVTLFPCPEGVTVNGEDCNITCTESVNLLSLRDLSLGESHNILKAFFLHYVQRSAKVFVRGCKKFVVALAYLFCLALLGSC